MMMKHPFYLHALVQLLILCIFLFLTTANNIYTSAVVATTNAAIPSLDQTTTHTNQEEGNYEALQIHDEFAKVYTHSAGGALEMNMEDVMGSIFEVQCDDGGDEEECMKRRVLSEAHLDYIYTQHHKP